MVGLLHRSLETPLTFLWAFLPCRRLMFQWPVNKLFWNFSSHCKCSGEAALQCEGAFKLQSRQYTAQSNFAASPTRHDKLLPGSQGEESLGSEGELTRISILYFHHIYNPKKRLSVKEFALRRDLSGIYLFGKPGRVLVEGSLENVEEYVKAIKRLRWQYVAVKETLERRGQARLFHGFVNVLTDKDFGNSMRQVGLGDTFQRFFDRCPSTNVAVNAANGGFTERHLAAVPPIRRSPFR
eukprot:GHVS01069485.1.p1 GENE.GHVS01069485.1~~GHVS01069485.1.p1  ORF type:complete len:239 (-),score=10.22 GHVS01069485.1:256-972(-)